MHQMSALSLVSLWGFFLLPHLSSLNFQISNITWNFSLLLFDEYECERVTMHEKHSTPLSIYRMIFLYLFFFFFETKLNCKLELWGE